MCSISPTMTNYDGSEKVDISISIDAQFYYQSRQCTGEIQPFSGD